MPSWFHLPQEIALEETDRSERMLYPSALVGSSIRLLGTSSALIGSFALSLTNTLEVSAVEGSLIINAGSAV